MASTALTIALIKALGGGGSSAPTEVSGSTPSITGQAGKHYVCGEVSTLSVTPPESGIIDVIFESGSTATVLTVPETVVWANDFDADNLEANTVYELSIMDGTWGVAAAWSTT